MIKKSALKILSLFFAISLIVNTYSAPLPSRIECPKYTDELSSDAAIVMEEGTSKVLYEYNSDKRMYPASLVKIMTAIIVLDKVKGNYDDLVTFSYTSVTKDIDRNSATIGASAGDQLSVKDCLYSLLLPSANDAANALAEYVAGSINDFVLLMNEKAKNLGLSNTNFVNPSGLHDDNQYTTAADMAQILRCAMSYPVFLQITSSVSYRHAPIRRYKNPNNSNNQILNTNSIMVPGSGYYYNGITSGKTGHTKLAGYNLAASANKDNLSLICVLLGGKSEKGRFNDAKNLFDFHYKNYKGLKVSNFDKRFKNQNDTISIDDVNLIKTLKISCPDNATLVLPKDADESNVNSSIYYDIKDKYNKYAIGYIKYYYNDTFLADITLEGRNVETDEPIFFSHLDLSKVSNYDSIDATNRNNNNTQLDINNKDKLIYRNNNGKIIVSSALKTTFVLLIIFILALYFIRFIYLKLILNINFPLNKYLFRIKRFFKK